MNLNWYSFNQTSLSSISSDLHYLTISNNTFNRINLKVIHNPNVNNYNNNLYYNEKLTNISTTFSSNQQSNDIQDALTFSPTVTIIIATIAALMSLITIIGNVFVITAFIIEKSLRKYSNYFILNLSIADLLIGLLIPPYAPFLLFNRHWKIGKVACTIWLVFDYVVGSASVLCIVVISLDRYLLVSRGLNYVAHQKISKAICIMLTVWLIAFLNYAPAILFWEIISGKSTVKDGECQVEFHDNLAYLTATACVEFFVPFVSICILNLAVYLNIRRRSRGLIRSENPKFKLSIRQQENQNDISANKNNELQTNINLLKSTNSKDLLKVNIETEKVSRKSSKNSSTNRLNEASIDAKSNPSSYSASSGDEEDSSVDNKSANSNRRRSSSNRVNSINDFASNSNNANNNEAKIKLLEKISRNNSLFKTPINGVLDNNVENNNHINNDNNNEAFIVTNMTKPNTSQQNHKKQGTFSNKNKKSKKDHAKSKLKKDKKAARALFIFVFVFFVCWAPYTLLTLIKSVCSTCINDLLYEFVFWLLWFNSTFNPILYSFLHVDFRRAFIRIIHSILFCFKFKKAKGKK